MFYSKHPSFQQPPTPPGQREGQHTNFLSLRFIAMAVVGIVLGPLILRPLYVWWETPIPRPLGVSYYQPPPPQAYVPPPQIVLPPPSQGTQLRELLPQVKLASKNSESPPPITVSLQNLAVTPSDRVEACFKMGLQHNVTLINPDWRQILVPANQGRTELIPANGQRMFRCGDNAYLHEVYKSKIDCTTEKNSCVDASGNNLPNIKPHEGTMEDPIVWFYLENSVTDAHEVSVTYQPNLP